MSDRFPELAGLSSAIARAEHGTRTCYVGQRCRCELCKAANRDYYRQRRDRLAALSVEVPLVPSGSPVRKPVGRGRTGWCCTGVNGAPCVAGGPWLKGRQICVSCVERATVWNGLVSPDSALAHLRKLSNQGIGYKSVSAASDVAASTLGHILEGSQDLIRADTERAILAVTAEARADSSCVPVGPTQVLVRKLMARGFTKGAIARLMGHQTAALQLGRTTTTITAKNAAKVERIWRRVQAGELAPAMYREPGKPIWEALERLRAAGMSFRFLETHLGFTVQVGGFGPWIRVSSANKVRAMVSEVVDAWRVGGEMPPGWTRSAVLVAVDLNERWTK